MPPEAASVSVIIPVHNKAPYVRRAIDSVLAQTSQPNEIIAIDDASTDGGAEILRSYGDRLHVLARDVPGPGGYAARNLGIVAARCDWIAFLDADDWWSSGHLANVRAAIADDVDCVFSRYADYRGPGDSKPHPSSAALMDQTAPIDATRFLDAWIEQHDCPLLTSASAFRRKALIDAGLFPAGRASRGGDKDLWLRVMMRSRARFVSDVSVSFDRSALNKVTHTVSTATMPVICETIAELLRDCDDQGLARRLRALANLEIAHYARQRFARGAIPSTMRQGLHMPEGWRDWIVLAGMSAAPLPVARMVRSALGRPVPSGTGGAA